MERQGHSPSRTDAQQPPIIDRFPKRTFVLLSPHRSWPAWTGVAPLDDEDREKPYRILGKRGFSWSRLDPNEFPKNPAGRAHPLFQAIDPLRSLQVLLKCRHADFVICFFESSALLILMFRRILGFRGKVVIVDLGMPGWKPRRMILNFVVPRADAILPYSSSQVKVIRDLWPDARLIHPVQVQVDTNFYAEAPDQPDGPVLAIGDDSSRDYDTLLAAAPSVPYGIAIRSSKLSSLKAPNVKVLEPLDLPAYRDLIASAAIIVLPMHPVENGGGTSVIVQAMASGKAVVATASPGILDYVEDGETALLVPCGDAEALAAAVTRLMGDHALRRRMGAAARQRALRLNSYEAWTKTIETVSDLLTTFQSQQKN